MTQNTTQTSFAPKQLIEYGGEDSRQYFEAWLAKLDILVLVDFWAPWCGPCRALTPTLQKLAEEGIVHVVKINVDQYPKISTDFSVRSIPFLVLFRGTKDIASRAGALSLQECKTWITSKASNE